MLIALLPMIAMSNDAFVAAAVDMPSPAKQRSAQVQLADALGAADSIDSVHGEGNTFTFAITRGDHRFDLVATTTEGEVSLVVEHLRRFDDVELGSLDWLVETMQETVAVTRLSVDEDGAVTLTTDEGMRYMAIPGRGSGGNAAASARWAGAWNSDEG